VTPRAERARLFSLPPRLLAAALAVAGAMCPSTAFAQDAFPSHARYETPNHGGIRGRIASVDGKFHITVRDDRGRAESVQLHHGTVIQPTGLTLKPGMQVAISGEDARDGFDADTIDTPYRYDTPELFCGPPGWWYPYGPDVLLIDCPLLREKLEKRQDP
jgi:hypothetical protein